MLRLSEFEIATPASLDEAVSALRENEGAQIVAGGTDLVPKLKRGQFGPTLLISLTRVNGLDVIEQTAGGIRIGALTTLKTIERSEHVNSFTSVHEAVSQVATPIIRNTATLGGNLLQDTRCRYYDRGHFWREAVGYCMKKEGDECKVAPGAPRCYASFCSDVAPAMIVLDAHATLHGEAERTVALEDLYEDDGMAHVNLQNEILSGITIEDKGYRSCYKKLRIRGGFDFPEIGIATALKNDGDGLQANVAVSSVGSLPFVVKEHVAKDGLPLLTERVYKAVKPMDTMFFPPAYRKTVVKRLLMKSFDELLSSR